MKIGDKVRIVNKSQPNWDYNGIINVIYNSRCCSVVFENRINELYFFTELELIEEIDQKTQIEDIIDEASSDEFMKFIKGNRKEIIKVLFESGAFDV